MERKTLNLNQLLRRFEKDLLSEYQKRGMLSPKYYFITGSVASGERRVGDVDITVIAPQDADPQLLEIIEREICGRSIDFYFTHKSDEKLLLDGLDPLGGNSVRKVVIDSSSIKKK